MKKILAISLLVTACLGSAMAGNKDRSGQAGANELLINPWARSSGWQGLNTAGVSGVEAMNLNCAGLASTQKTEIVFSRTEWLAGSGISINAGGFSQKLGDKGGVLGVSIMSIGFGDIQITTTSLPEGGLGTYKPQFLNLALAYSKVFSNSIYGGFVVRGISESISNVGAFGLSIDAGVQYHTGNKTYPERMKFGIALRNIGTPMKFGGDGLSFKGNSQETGSSSTSTYVMTVEQRSAKFELPSLLNIGASYDFHPGTSGNTRITLAANFTSNSFTRDQVGIGLEGALHEMFMLRVAYNYEGGILSTDQRTNVMTGLSAGLSVVVPAKETGPHFELDYSFRATNPWNGIHSIGVRAIL